MEENTKKENVILNRQFLSDTFFLLSSIVKLFLENICYLLIYPITSMVALLKANTFYGIWKVNEKSWDSDKKNYYVKLDNSNKILIIPAQDRTLADNIQTGKIIIFNFKYQFAWPIPTASNFLKVKSNRI